MPNFDGGHYFLTVLVPVRTDAVAIGEGRYRSHVDLLRETLTRLPTARQNEVTRNARLNSPFARNRLNHLARFVVIDDVVYNGRESGHTLIERFRGINPIIPQPVDRLRCSYLFFGADIDAPSGADAALRAYTDSLWATMREELTEVFKHCLGFDRVQDAGDFFRYIKSCQLETTMPFHDYWTDPLPAKSIPLGNALRVAGALVLATLAAFGLQLLGIGGLPWGLLGLVGVALTAALGVGAYHFLVARGGEPFPTAPNSDLPSVLKALYLQQHFTQFAIDNQGIDAETLHQRFAAFIGEHQPDDVDHPTQPPGVISAREREVPV